MLNESMGLIPPNDMNRIIKKDALYNAIGLAAFELFDEVDFDRWFSQVSAWLILFINLPIKYRINFPGFIARASSQRKQLSHSTTKSCLASRSVDRS